MRFAKAGAATAAVAVLAMIMSGCVVFFGTSKVKQVGDKPKVKISFGVCVSGDPTSACPDGGNSGGNSVSPSDRRLLIGFRVPKGTKPPQTIEPTSVDFGTGGGTDETVLSRDGSYAGELNAKAPHGSKYKYVGYSSEPFTFTDDVGTGASAQFRVRMAVKDKLVGKRFKVRPVVGNVQVSSAQPADGPIDCGDDPFVGRTDFSNIEDGDYVICIDSPSPDAFTNLKVKIKE